MFPIQKLVQKFMSKYTKKSEKTLKQGILPIKQEIKVFPLFSTFFGMFDHKDFSLKFFLGIFFLENFYGNFFLGGIKVAYTFKKYLYII